MNNFSNVELAKFPELDEVDQKLFDSSLTRFFRKAGEDARLHMTLKQYKRGGLRLQHEVHARVVVGSKSFFASDEEWLLVEAVQRVLDKLAKEIKKEVSRKE